MKKIIKELKNIINKIVDAKIDVYKIRLNKLEGRVIDLEGHHLNYKPCATEGSSNPDEATCEDPNLYFSELSIDEKPKRGDLCLFYSKDEMYIGRFRSSEFLPRKHHPILGVGSYNYCIVIQEGSALHKLFKDLTA